MNEEGDDEGSAIESVHRPHSPRLNRVEAAPHMAGAVGPSFSVSREKSDDVRWALENAATAMIARRACLGASG